VGVDAEEGGGKGGDEGVLYEGVVGRVGDVGCGVRWGFVEEVCGCEWLPIKVGACGDWEFLTPLYFLPLDMLRDCCLGFCNGVRLERQKGVVCFLAKGRKEGISERKKKQDRNLCYTITLPLGHSLQSRVQRSD